MTSPVHHVPVDLLDKKRKIQCGHNLQKVMNGDGHRFTPKEVMLINQFLKTGIGFTIVRWDNYTQSQSLQFSENKLPNNTISIVITNKTNDKI